MEHTFEITITAQDNLTWQGTLKTVQGVVPFRSEMELLMELSRMMGYANEVHPVFAHLRLRNQNSRSTACTEHVQIDPNLHTFRKEALHMSEILNHAVTQALQAAYSSFMAGKQKDYDYFIRVAREGVSAIRNLGHDPDYYIARGGGGPISGGRSNAGFLLPLPGLPRQSAGTIPAGGGIHVRSPLPSTDMRHGLSPPLPRSVRLFPYGPEKRR